MILRAILIWVLLAAVGVANGVVRGAVLVPKIGDQRAHVLSTLILGVLIAVLSLAFIKWIGPSSVLQASLIGLLWAVLTVLFEFVAGHYVFENSWERLFADYNLWRGRIWVLIPVVMYLAPRWAFRVRV